jgi:hypothetical protein
MLTVVDGVREGRVSAENILLVDVALETIQVFCARTQSERGDSRATRKIHETQQSTSPPLMNP